MEQGLTDMSPKVQHLSLAHILYSKIVLLPVFGFLVDTILHSWDRRLMPEV